MTMPSTEASTPSHQRTAVGGGVGGALGVLVTLFMPESWYVFTPETASVATAAFGVIFSYGMRWLPAPTN